MGKIKDPINFSTAFNLDKEQVISVGVVDVILNADTNLFIDPLLLEDSQHPEISKDGYSRYQKYFQLIIKLLMASKVEGDTAWRNAKSKFQFHEISWTCLGYGGSTSGSGFGTELIASTLTVAKEIVELGVTDVELFMGLALFEEGIGADRISDMTTNIILPDLLSFNKRVIKKLGLETSEFIIKSEKHLLLPNPCAKKRQPLILVPYDIVRDLPIAADWGDISRVVRENRQLRDRINEGIGGIWATMTREKKLNVKTKALRSKDSFGLILEAIRQSKGIPYDIQSDLNGEVFWGDLVPSIAKDFPHDLSPYSGQLNHNQVYELVGEIISQFKLLIEKKGLWKELWDESQEVHRKEKAAQRLFFAIADSYCKANRLDLSPEADTGNGPVDFKVSSGDLKVLVEIKLSSNPKLPHGYMTQLKIYKEAEETDLAYYLVVAVGDMTKKGQTLLDLKEQQIQDGKRASEIIFVDGTPKKSASKRG